MTMLDENESINEKKDNQEYAQKFHKKSTEGFDHGLEKTSEVKEQKDRDGEFTREEHDVGDLAAEQKSKSKEKLIDQMKDKMRDLEKQDKLSSNDKEFLENLENGVQDLEADDNLD